MICGKLLSRKRAFSVCETCIILDRAVDRGTSLWIYDDFIKPLIYKYKYKGHTYLYEYFATCLINRLVALDLPFEIDRIIPVPCHPRRRKRRGYDPVGGLCRALSKKTGLVLDDHLVRVYHTPKLHGEDACSRAKILESAFTYKGELSGTVLLVDDIYTTGHTMNFCAKALKAAGADYVVSISLCVGSDQ